MDVALWIVKTSVCKKSQLVFSWCYYHVRDLFLSAILTLATLLSLLRSMARKANPRSPGDCRQNFWEKHALRTLGKVCLRQVGSHIIQVWKLSFYWCNLRHRALTGKFFDVSLMLRTPLRYVDGKKWWEKYISHPSIRSVSALVICSPFL